MNGFDLAVFSYLHAWADVSPVLDAIVFFCAAYLVYAMALAVGIWQGYIYFFGMSEGKGNARRLLSLATIGTIVSRIVIAEPVRVLVSRARPYETLALSHQLIEHALGRSFPSGHTTVAFAIAAAVYTRHRLAGVVLILAAGVVGASRVIAGVHWPTDIIGGAVVGVVGVWIARKIMSRSPEFFIWKQ